MMRVLVIDEALPFPADSGKRIRTWEIMRRLAGEFDITFVYHQESPTALRGLDTFRQAGVRIVSVKRPPLVKNGLPFAWDLARNVVLPTPYMVMAHSTSILKDQIRFLATQFRSDLIHVEWTPLFVNVPRDLGLPVVIAAHNVETQIWERYLENEKRAIRRPYIALQVKKVERFERRALGAADHVMSVSELDAQKIRTWASQSRVTVAPNGVNIRRFKPRPEAEVVPGSILFVGSLDWRPNLDGVTWFLEAIWPLVKRRAPHARFAVVGRNPPGWLLDSVARMEDVRIHASVPDVRPYVASSAVSVVPLRIGGGSRLKICEALAMERPVVSTRVGAEGLHLTNSIFLADDPGSFASQVAEVLATPASAAATARRGRDQVLARHAWGVIAPKQAEAWRQAVEVYAR